MEKYEFHRRHEDMGGRLGAFLNGFFTHGYCTQWTVRLAADVEYLSGTGLDYTSKYSDPVLDKLEWAFAVRVRYSEGKYVIE
jgi:hypothetical protein